jgi:hypothetical protein
MHNISAMDTMLPASLVFAYQRDLITEQALGEMF